MRAPSSLMLCLALLGALAAGTVLADGHDASGCRELNADFIILEGEANLMVLEDDIRADLAKVGITVTMRALNKTAMNAAMVGGDYNMAFSETWGPPYDPHSYAASWNTTDEAYYSALAGLPEPNTAAVLAQKIKDVLYVEDEDARQAEWSTILQTMHEQATELPFSGKRIPAVINARLSGYAPGEQQFDYPVHKLRVLSGSRNITLAPGGQTGLFKGVGFLEAHSYRPNEFFANNWVYEGLVEYGPDGTILPSLATSWAIVDLAGGAVQYTFTLREGVKFHDGADWNCAAAKLNFDHVLAPGNIDNHNWYGMPAAIASWTCTDPTTFVVTTTGPYYPLLQELSLIRPLRMLSPDQFAEGVNTDPRTHNSCPARWGSAMGADGVETVCAGTLGVAGTGRWHHVSTTMGAWVTDANGDQEQQVDEVLFKRFTGHWDSAAGNVVDYMTLVRYADSAAIETALKAGTLDAVIGDGVLLPATVAEFKSEHKALFHTYLSEPLQNRIVVLNTNKAPTDDLEVRKVIIHAVNKAAIIHREMYGLAEPATSLFPKSAPNCDIDLTPTWDYDIQKARLLNCAEAPAVASGDDDELSTGGIVGIAVAACVAGLLFVVLLVVVQREKDGNPIFSPLIAPEAKGTEMA